MSKQLLYELNKKVDMLLGTPSYVDGDDEAFKKRIWANMEKKKIKKHSKHK